MFIVQVFKLPFVYLEPSLNSTLIGQLSLQVGWYGLGSVIGVPVQKIGLVTLFIIVIHDGK